jgi:hypothetical protein
MHHDCSSDTWLVLQVVSDGWDSGECSGPAPEDKHPGHKELLCTGPGEMAHGSVTTVIILRVCELNSLEDFR